MRGIRYRLSLPRPESHLFHVSMALPGAPAETVDLVLPSWTPGSYRIRDYARHLQDFSAGKHRWKKIAKNRWRVHTAGAESIRISYRIFAFELTVRTCHLDADHGYLNGAGVFLYPDGGKDLPATVRIVAPRGWRVATGLRRIAAHDYRAENYDALVDSPIEIGRFREFRFRVRRIPHRLILHGEGNYDPASLVRDMRKIVAAEIAMMRHIPYRDYTFLLHTLPEGAGGLEHKNSCSLQYPSFAFRPREKYERFLSLVAHEFFHLWNAKRIRPEGMGPFDYEREVYTPLLWVMEGITRYYDGLIPRRAGLISPARYLERLAEDIRKYEEKPGRKRQSLTESSFDAWIKLYQANENSPNDQMSYYEKGALVGLLLDLEIRNRSRNRRSLDDVIRSLYAEYGKKDRAYPESAFRRTCERIAGGSLEAFFRDYVEGTAAIPWDRLLRAAGLSVVEKEGAASPIWSGMTCRGDGPRVEVVSVLEDSPAEDAGLAPRDEIIALGGIRVAADTWEARLGERPRGERVRVHYVRAGLLRETTLIPKGPLRRPLSIRPRKNPNSLQARIYRDWLRVSDRS